MILILVALSTLVSCALLRPSAKSQREQDRQQIQAELSQEASLAEDREKLADLRREIPAEKQKENDELALQLKLMGQSTEQPHLLRQKFQFLVQKRRTAFRQKTQKLRDEFRTQETRRREDFFAAQKSKRDIFFRRKRDSKQNREFFAGQEKERQRFATEERERRMNFESELSAESKDFNSYMRERQNEFNEQFRLYSKKFSERPKASKAVTGEINEFKRLQEVPATPLGTED